MSSLALVPVTSDTDPVWRTVAEGLARINAHEPEPIGVDALFDLCAQERAFLFVGRDGEFVVLYPQFDHLFRRRTVLIVAAYSPFGDAVSLHKDAIDRLARDIGAESIEFYTTRKGFARVAPSVGYELTHHVYRREL